MKPIFLSLSTAVFFALGAPAAAVHAPREIEKSSIIEHLRVLASDSLEGRGAGTRGGHSASLYIQQEFGKLGLLPAGEAGGFFQEFPFTRDIAPGDSNILEVRYRGETLTAHAGTDFLPLSSSSTGTAEGPLLFAGYGLVNEEKGYDDWMGGMTHGAIALVLEGVPPVLEGFENAQGKPLVRKKAMLGREAGAAGILLVRGKDAGALAGTKFDGIPDDVGIPYAEVTWAFAERICASGGVSLDSLAGHSGAAVMGEPEPFEDTSVKLSTEVDKVQGTGRNVLAVLPGRDPVFRDEYLVIGAHLDHLGKELGPEGEEIIYNGADDNASGVAGLLELARSLKAAGLRRSVLFAAFDAEEIGALGSLYFTKEPPVPLAKIVAMVNLDMIGRMKERTLIVSGYDTSPGWDGLLEKANEGIGLDLKKSPGGFGGSDHSSFYKESIPVLFFFTGAHDDYNTPRDDWERINVRGEVLILDYVEKVIEAICDQDARPTFARSREAPRAERRSAMPVYVGTVPDFAFSGTGFAIIGTKEGSPAEKAGLAKGDVIVRIDGKEVRNIYDYMSTLSGKKPGDRAVFTVLRGGSELSLEVTLTGNE